jgi:hypothetical protein
MTLGAISSNATLALAMASAGFIFGRVYFAALRRTAVEIVTGSGWMFVVALTLGRYGAAIIFLGLAAQFGAIPLLSAFLGFLAARRVALHSTN